MRLRADLTSTNLLQSSQLGEPEHVHHIGGPGGRDQRCRRRLEPRRIGAPRVPRQPPARMVGLKCLAFLWVFVVKAV